MLVELRQKSQVRRLSQLHTATSIFPVISRGLYLGHLGQYKAQKHRTAAENWGNQSLSKLIKEEFKSYEVFC